MSEIVTETKTPIPPIFKKLTERQLKLVAWLTQHPEVMFDLTVGWGYGRKNEYSVNIHVDGLERYQIASRIDSAINTQSWGRGRVRYDSVVNGLMKKGLLQQVTVVRPAEYNEKGHLTTKETVRYTLSNEARQAAGGAALAIEQVKLAADAAVARQNAWKAAVAPLDVEAEKIRRRMATARHEASAALTEATPATLIKLHQDYHTAQADLAAVNYRLAAIAAEHGRKPEPYTEKGY